jgi:PAS domain S-box-containing protein
LRQTEEALRESERQLRTITDNLPAFIAYTDKDQRLQFANKTAAEWYGDSKEGLIGKSARELLSKEAYEQVKHRFEEVLSGNSVRVEEFREFPDGTTRYVDNTNIPNIDDGLRTGWRRSGMAARLRRSWAGTSRR